MSDLTCFYEAQLVLWQDVKQRFDDLQHIKIRSLGKLKAQFNPSRMISTGAKIDRFIIEKRPCFLCAVNRPKEQIVKSFNSHFDILINPFPILPKHFTIPSIRHEPQQIKNSFIEMLQFVEEYAEEIVFYNGPFCGASAPDHLHFQAVPKMILPVYENWKALAKTSEEVIFREDAKVLYVNDYVCPLIAITGLNINSIVFLFNKIYKELPLPEGNVEPMMNVISWKEKDLFVTLIFPRLKHRPDCYYGKYTEQCLVSPGAIDMGGLIILPRREDFETITPLQATSILKEVTLAPEDVEKVLSQLKK